MPARKQTSKVIRNLRGTAVHLRFTLIDVDKPKRVELKPRGTPGDMQELPSYFSDCMEWMNNEGILFEVIPKSEALKTTYEIHALTGHLKKSINPGHKNPWEKELSVVKTAEQTIVTKAKMGSDGKLVQTRAVQAPGHPNLPGSDPAFSNQEVVQQATDKQTVVTRGVQNPAAPDQGVRKPANRAATQKKTKLAPPVE